MHQVQPFSNQVDTVFELHGWIYPLFIKAPYPETIRANVHMNKYRSR
jgi:hypothetical protein